MSFEYDINDEPLVFHKALFDRLLQDEKPMEALSLYAFYYYTAKWQKTNQVKATTNYAAKGLKCSADRIRRIKKRLIEYGLIKDVQQRDKNNKVVGHYIQIYFIWTQETVKKMSKTHPQGFAESGCTPTVGNPETNALSSININALSSDSENALSSDNDSSESLNAFSSENAPRRKRKKSSMKDKVKQKASMKKKKQTSDKVPYENIANTQLLTVWNQQDNLRSHKTRSSRVYKDTLRKLEAMRQGTLYKSVSEDTLQNNVPYEWFSAKWKKKEISKAIKTLNEWCKEGNYPKNKDWIKKLSLSDAIFNPRTGSPLMQAFQSGVKKIYDPYKELKSKDELAAYDRFAHFFDKELGKHDVKTQKQIVELVKSFNELREKYKNNWKRYDPDYFGYGYVPSTVHSLAIDYTEFLKGQYHTDFTAKESLTPNGLKIGGFVWGKFEKAYEHRFDANPISGPK